MRLPGLIEQLPFDMSEKINLKDILNSPLVVVVVGVILFVGLEKAFQPEPMSERIKNAYLELKKIGHELKDETKENEVKQAVKTVAGGIAEGFRAGFKTDPGDVQNFL